ncbi:FAD-binding oxidoreductase [Xanthobacter autotrophicus]|uniref:FAD-binding oxidoreductase n=1 Tax=Xanthobacter autotrophicus TaxID=280 RepID=UPI00372A3284
MPHDRNEVLQALQSIVGEANATNDPSVICSYAWNAGVGSMPGPKFLKNWPIAVVMPGTTEDVAAIIKCCVARGLSFRPLSSGNGGTYLSASADVVVLDLCRMNRLVKLDAANQMAVIEPYVTAGRLQAEAMKAGLTCHIVGAGPSHSPLASATSFLGIGITGASTGANARNILGIEWVTPTGDIVRIGALGGDDDWFSEEGPGPGLRGMIRGLIGANGGLGVFTRIGYKLYPWAGPPRIAITGTSPMKGMALEPNMRLFLPVWDTVEQMRDASFRLNRAGVAFALLRMPPNHIGWTLTASNGEYARRREAGLLPECARPEHRFGWQVLTIGHSPGETAYQEKTVRHIVSDTGGRMLPIAQNDAEMLVRTLVTSLYVSRVFRGAGSGGTSFGVMDSFNLLPDVIRASEQLMVEEKKPGHNFAADGDEGCWVWPTESRQLWTENILASQAGTVRGVAAGWKGFLRHLNMVDHNPRLGLMGFMAGPLIELFGPRYGDVATWMRRIKRRLDPPGLADSTVHVGINELPIAKWWPTLQKIAFSTAGAPALHLLCLLLGVASRKEKLPKRKS